MERLVGISRREDRAGETPEQALKREIKEELNTVVQVGELADVIEYDYPDCHLTMYRYFARCFRGIWNCWNTNRPLAGKGELDTVNWLPAD